MKLSDLVPSFKAHQAKTDAELAEQKSLLATANKQISDLSAEVTNLKATAAVKAEEATDESSEVDQLISELQGVLDKFKSGEDSEDKDSSDDSTDSDVPSDDSDDANDESAKASKVEKLKALTAAAKTIVAEAKAVKASVPQQVIREIASIGIPTPIATKPDGKAPALKGLDRVSAAFSEQLNSKK